MSTKSGEADHLSEDADVALVSYSLIFPKGPQGTERSQNRIISVWIPLELVRAFTERREASRQESAWPQLHMSQLLQYIQLSQLGQGNVSGCVMDKNASGSFPRTLKLFRAVIN
jgi:hypothetical protein